MLISTYIRRVFDVFVSAREDEEEASPAPAEVEDAMDQDEANPQLDDEGNVVASAARAPSSSPKRRSSPLELEIFSDDVLRELKKDVLAADVANVEGTFIPNQGAWAFTPESLSVISGWTDEMVHMITYHTRTTVEIQTEHGRLDRVPKASSRV